MDPQMTFNGPLQGQSVVAGMTVSGGTANVHFHYAADDFRSAPLRVLPFSRNEDIVGRPGILSQLSQLLPISEARSAALYGLGGYGKTQLALEFAYLRAGDDETCAIFWVHADTEAAFAQDYALIARKGGLSVSDGEELLIAVRLFIEAQRRWLLVLDNADDLRLFGVGATTCTYPSSQAPSKSLNQYLPKSPTGSILWTSRDSRIAGSLVGPMRAIRITNMLPLEAQVLFATAKGSPLRDDELDDAVALLAELHYIPLPVSQAAAYIRRTAIPIKGYLSRLKDGNKRWFLLKRTDFDRHRREGITNSILETWNITIKHLRHESEAAVEILQTLAYIDNQNISGDIVRAAAATAAADADASVVAVGVFQGDEQKLWWADNENLEHTHSTSDAIDDSDEDVDKTAEGSAGGDDDAIADAVTRLRELSFLHMTIRSDGEPVYDMHQLVQEAMLYSHSVESDSRAQTRYIRRAIRILTMLFPDRSQENWEEFCLNSQ
ncbi:TPR domain-containing protein [Colletotrichum higginsianum]|uniref:TPR domain-containing protein n=1 Tax=Colletotrichum higginsianum (strain IMI 349063) TaxID=759273 RepID=H1V162_COLHI|nr:TPR domain-containing protein [Colletotrichum higginsianum]